MSLEYLLKTGRENAHLTQERAAELLDVETNTVSNWETGKTIPHDQGILQSIINVYGLDRDAFAKAYFDAVCPPEQMPDNFPYYLFSDDGMKKLKEITLTPQETNLIIMLCIYTVSQNQEKKSDNAWSMERVLYNIWESEPGILFRDLPYDYVKETGTSELCMLLTGIRKKCKRYTIFKRIGRLLMNPQAENASSSFQAVRMPERELIYLAGMTYFNNVPLTEIKQACSLIENGDNIVYERGSNDRQAFSFAAISNEQKVKLKTFMKEIDNYWKPESWPAPILLSVSLPLKKGWKDLMSFFAFINEDDMTFADPEIHAYAGSGKDEDDKYKKDTFKIQKQKRHFYLSWLKDLSFGLKPESPFSPWIEFTYETGDGKETCRAYMTAKGKELMEYCKTNHVEFELIDNGIKDVYS